MSIKNKERTTGSLLCTFKVQILKIRLKRGYSEDKKNKIKLS